MSIQVMLDHWVKEGELFKLTPRMPDDPVERAMYVSEEIWRLLDGPWADESIERRCGRLRADLEQFVSGRVIALSMVPYEAKSALLGLLHAPTDGIWDFRSADPSPGLRLLGAFATTDVFVALTPGAALGTSVVLGARAIRRRRLSPMGQSHTRVQGSLAAPLSISPSPFRRTGQ